MAGLGTSPSAEPNSTLTAPAPWTLPTASLWAPTARSSNPSPLKSIRAACSARAARPGAATAGNAPTAMAASTTTGRRIATRRISHRLPGGRGSGERGAEVVEQVRHATGDPALGEQPAAWRAAGDQAAQHDHGPRLPGRADVLAGDADGQAVRRMGSLLQTGSGRPGTRR